MKVETIPDKRMESSVNHIYQSVQNQMGELARMSSLLEIYPGKEFDQKSYESILSELIRSTKNSITELSECNQVLVNQFLMAKQQQLFRPHSKIFVFGGVSENEHLKSGNIYDIRTNVWSQVVSMDLKRACLLSSIVYALGSIYIFGGNDILDCLEKYNVETNQMMRIPIQTCGGSSIATCYNGQEIVYLVGGYKNKTMDRIDAFNIRTNETIEIGKLNMPRYYAFSFFHYNMIYTIGGTYKNGTTNYTLVNSLERFNINTRRSETILSLELSERIEGACFDGNDTIYIMTNKQFLKVSLISLEMMILPDVQMIGKYGVSLVYTKLEDGQSRIYLFGGKNQQDHYFDVSNRRWKSINGKTKRTIFQGAVAV
ncbi:hypothetical protein PPL_01872 [Heterostelium album PN500]|uniref:Kelch motif family protein n=1 Tax=Heterostelium pallidum (strain ATCC 26659 / Pp 5 / PN500) TaxID=670386 RepID=D3B0Q5_HETP5|nr:hypothetical protein PPL_01872 [Heterostelium album PN500]EFA84879.1 hypothetical protein PPL_01872 [Heterostelium album PN500]|eukprot:XP_020436990.1 hypothetical protein PPL_01872 [Heterostelium album PN500]